MKPHMEFAASIAATVQAWLEDTTEHTYTVAKMGLLFTSVVFETYMYFPFS